MACIACSTLTACCVGHVACPCRILRAERIVVHPLDDASAAASLDHLADAAEVVAVVVVEGEVVLAGVAGILRRLCVALVEEVLVDAPVPHREAAPEEVIYGVRAQDFRGGKLPGAADGDGDAAAIFLHPSCHNVLFLCKSNSFLAYYNEKFIIFPNLCQ